MPRTGDCLQADDNLCAGEPMGRAPWTVIRFAFLLIALSAWSDACDGPAHGGSGLSLIHVATHEMPVGTHRPEILALENGQLMVIVVQPTDAVDGIDECQVP
ncbi:MAG: hypothetical protein HYV63_14690 [Candidatus Schekmanbacteria bacterium]|nr:hypothetical protein [Candidatus Schekmanbacteria bacterium]